MSNWGGRSNRGHSNYYQNANRLREKLGNRSQAEDQAGTSSSTRPPLNPPPGLKGREIGMWYKQQQQAYKSKSPEEKFLQGPNVSLPQEKAQRIRSEISSWKEDQQKPTSNIFQNDFLRHKNSDFMEVLKSSAKSFYDHSPEIDHSELDENLRNEFLRNSASDNYQKMLEFRQKLPAHQHKQDIIELIKKNQIVLVEGNTGCGKTTQVAQYILDDALMNYRGSHTRVLCTQPRRIAAISIAERVASERAEPLGHSIGYQIRLEKVMPRSKGSVVFCTTGVLLKFMELDPALSGYSHIIIDEIHERDVLIDLCLALIKKIVEHRKDLKIILMSATLNAESFSRYFDNCPMIHIEGFTFPVTDLFLEDILEETGYDNFGEKRSVKEPVWVRYKQKKQRQDQDEQFDLIVGNFARSLRDSYSPTTIKNLLNPETEKLNVDFIVFLIDHISFHKGPGAILVILPGFSIISKVYDSLQNNPKFPSDKFVIHPLHSLLTGNDQRNIFIRPPEGVRKIILSTPMAETSITIDDVVYVVNAGKMRKPYFDFKRNASVFEDEWITKANETQRKGRAGRVSAGLCYHLYTKGRSNSLELFEQPEILRIRLEEVLLTIKALCIKNMQEFISTFINVPDENVVSKSISMLQRLGALTEAEELTPLGLHLARLATHPQIGKMLLLSSIFSCFDPMSSIAASLSFKSPFYTVMGKEEDCNMAKRKFCADSDQLAVAFAVKHWEECVRSQRSFCYSNFLSHTTLLMLKRFKNQFTQSLHQSKFLQSPDCDNQESNKNSGNSNVLRAMICGGLYPNIAYRSVKVTRHKRKEIIKTADTRVKLFPSSVNCDKDSVYPPGYLVFHEQQKLSDQLFLVESTANVGPYAILMFGDRIMTTTEGDTHYVSVGGMVRFKCNRETSELIMELREQFNRLLEKKIVEPSPINWAAPEGKLLKAIVELVSFGTPNNFDDYDDAEGEGDEDEDK